MSVCNENEYISRKHVYFLCNSSFNTLTLCVSPAGNSTSRHTLYSFSNSCIFSASFTTTSYFLLTLSSLDWRWEPLQQQHMRLFNARMVGKMQWADTHVGSQEDMKFWKGKFILTLRSHCAAANRRKSSADDDKAVSNKSERMSEIARLPYEESGSLLRPGCLEAALVGVTSRSAPLHILTPCSLRPVLVSHLLSLQTYNQCLVRTKVVQKVKTVCA
jgi:hypothetical protein